MFKVGDLVDVSSEQVEFLCSVDDVLEGVDVEPLEECAAIYHVTCEGAENPYVEPEITIYEYSGGDIYAVDDSKYGFEYQQVTAVLRVKSYRRII